VAEIDCFSKRTNPMKNYLLICSLLLACLSAWGTHLRAGYIQAVRANSTNLTYRITITMFTSTVNAPVPFGGDTDISYLYFGDGQKVFVPETANSIRYDLDAEGKVASASYTVLHTYSSYGTHLIHYAEPSRNAGVINASNTLTTLFYVETLIAIDPFLDPSSTPIRISTPIFHTTAGDEFSYSLASRDSIDQTLFYELVNPRSAPNQSVENYQLPENFSINSVNGLITWDTKFHGAYQVGEYAFAARIYQFQGGYLSGYMTIDFQIILEENESGRLLSDNKEPDENARIYIPTGSSRTIRVFAEDPLADSIKIAGFSELENEALFGDAYSFTLYDSLEGNRKISVGVFEVKNNEAITRDNPYAIVIRATYYRGRSEPYKKDLGYLFYTKDVELEYPEIILSVTETEQQVSFYPNPAKDFIFIDDKQVQSVNVIALDGRQMIYHNCNESSMMDLRELSPGIYLLQVRTRNNRKSVVRLVKE
jgi:hypothetical protein